MTETIDLNQFSEEDPSSPAARGLAKLHEAWDAGAERASCTTTEAIMVALALCDRAYLPDGLVDAPAGLLWFRLDDSQRRAIQLFGLEMSKGGVGPRFSATSGPASK